MAALDVAGVTSRWLRQVANDGEMLDRTEMMYSDMYHPEEEEETGDRDSGRCCRCSCPPDTPCVTQEPGPDFANSSESVLSQFSFRCGCREVCYTFQGQKVGRGQRTSCDGSMTHCQYRFDRKYKNTLSIMLLVLLGEAVCTASAGPCPRLGSWSRWAGGDTEHRLSPGGLDWRAGVGW